MTVVGWLLVLAGLLLVLELLHMEARSRRGAGRGLLGEEE